MGILLSKPDEESVLENNGAPALKPPRKRNGGRRDSDIGATRGTRKRQRTSSCNRTLSAVKSSFLETEAIVHKDISVQGSGNTSDSDSQDSPSQRKKKSYRERKRVSDDSVTVPLKLGETSLSPSDPMTSSLSAPRKRKSPTSPYFKAPAMRLSSPPTTPTPSEKSLDKRSKISVIENGTYAILVASLSTNVPGRVRSDSGETAS